MHHLSSSFEVADATLMMTRTSSDKNQQGKIAIFKMNRV